MGTCPASIYGAFSRTQFMGASVKRFSTKLGWGSERSELTVDVYEDSCAEPRTAYDSDGNPYITTEPDAFDPPQLGSPCYFQFGTFVFAGVLQHWERRSSINGRFFTVTLSDPREILDGTKIILNHYSGGVYNTPNLINMYAHLEQLYGAYCPPHPTLPSANQVWSLGFGGAIVNEAGMSWNQIRSQLQYLINNPATQTSGGLWLRSNQFYIDISELPYLDEYYRIEGDNASLQEIISNVTAAAGQDYFVELQWVSGGGPHIIKVFTSNRKVQPGSAEKVDTYTGIPITNRLKFGEITNFASKDEGAETNNAGIELRHEITNSFLVGDYRKDLWQIGYSGTGNTYSDTIWPYWGKDDLGVPLVSQGWDFNHNFNTNVIKLNIRSVYNNAPLVYYNINISELMTAQDSYDSWATYMWYKKKFIAQQIGLDRSIDLEKTFTSLFASPMPTDSKSTNREAGRLAAYHGREEAYSAQCRRLYDFVKQYADTYFGQKFMVGLPNMCVVQDQQEPLKVKMNWQTTDAAWTDANSVLGLGNPSPVLSLFKTDDGQVTPFVYVVSPLPLDLSNFPDSDYIQLNYYVAYVKCQIEEIIFLDPFNYLYPRAVISIAAPIYVKHPYFEKAPAHAALLYLLTGNVDLVNSSLNTIGSDATHVGSNFLPILPRGAAIPLKSNQYTYGPWYGFAYGPGGKASKTDYEFNPSFSPWQFGSSNIMANAGIINAVGKVSNQISIESGSVTKPGLPPTNLGRALDNAGPELTSVDTTVDAQGGVKTTVRAKTFTPKYGEIARQKVRTLMDLGQKVRKVQVAFMRTWVAPSILGVAANQVRMLTRSDRFNRQTSQDMIACESKVDGADPYASGRYYSVSTNLTKLLPELDANSSQDYVRKAAVGTNAIFRGYSTKDGDPWFPSFETDLETTNQAGLVTPTAAVESFNKRYGSRHYYSPEQVPPVFGEDHLSITSRTMNPFLNTGTVDDIALTENGSNGHDIEYVVRDGVYPVDLSVRFGGYSENEWYRGIALKGPLVMAGWGMDINNKPVPNADEENGNSLKFADNFLRRPYTWKVGPIDLRWDENRGMWVPPPAFKIVKLLLIECLTKGNYAKAYIVNENVQYDADGNEIDPPEDADVDDDVLFTEEHTDNYVYVKSLHNNDVAENEYIYGFYDTKQDRYYMLSHSQEYMWTAIMDQDMQDNTYLGTATLLSPLNRDVGRSNEINKLIGKKIKLSNYTKHPIKKGKTVYVHIYQICPTIYGVVLQAEYQKLNVVTDIDVECGIDQCYGCEIDAVESLTIDSRTIYVNAAIGEVTQDIETCEFNCVTSQVEISNINANLEISWPEGCCADMNYNGELTFPIFGYIMPMIYDYGRIYTKGYLSPTIDISRSNRIIFPYTYDISEDSPCYSLYYNPDLIMDARYYHYIQKGGYGYQLHILWQSCHNGPPSSSPVVSHRYQIFVTAHSFVNAFHYPYSPGFRGPAVISYFRTGWFEVPSQYEDLNDFGPGGLNNLIASDDAEAFFDSLVYHQYKPYSTVWAIDCNDADVTVQLSF